MSRTAVVVGTGNGFGTTCFRQFARSGVDSAICSARAEATDSIARELREAGHTARSIECDPRNPVAIARGIVDVVDAFGGIDVVAFVAGSSPGGGLFELTRSEFLDGMDRDLLGGFCTARAVVPKMQETGGGTLLFIGGSESLAGKGEAVGPSCTQAGLRGLAASIGDELGGEIETSYIAVSDVPDAEGSEAPSPIEAIADRCADLVIGESDLPLENEYHITWDGDAAAIEAVEAVSAR